MGERGGRGTEARLAEAGSTGVGDGVAGATTMPEYTPYIHTSQAHLYAREAVFARDRASGETGDRLPPPCHARFGSLPLERVAIDTRWRGSAEELSATCAGKEHVGCGSAGGMAVPPGRGPNTLDSVGVDS